MSKLQRVSEKSLVLEEGPALQFLDELDFFCKSKKLSSSALATKAGVSRSTLYSWRKGSPISAKLAERVGQRLGVEALLSYTRPPRTLPGPERFLDHFRCAQGLSPLRQVAAQRRIVGYCSVWLATELEALGIPAFYSESRHQVPYSSQVVTKNSLGNPLAHIQFSGKADQLIYQGFLHHPGGATRIFEGTADAYAFQCCIEFMKWATRGPSQKETNIKIKMSRELDKHYGRKR